MQTDRTDPGCNAAPELIRTEDELDELLTRARAALVEFMPRLSSPLVILGAGGKMGPTLAMLAHRAAEAAGHRLDVIAVSRFSDEGTKHWLARRGVKTLKADLLQRGDVERLPDSENVVYLLGLKFGTQQDPGATWAANTLAPAHVAERYASARIVALSTGNVYPLGPTNGGGAQEEHALTPFGEYANAAVARERIFEYFARKNHSRTALIRLSYAVELRYGVLVDIARKVRAAEPVDVSNGSFNCIWQGDANEMILRALALAASPPAVFNLTCPAILSVREVATKFSELLGHAVKFVGLESDTALLSNPAKLCAEFGPPPTPLGTIIRWTAHWVKNGGRYLDKPTHFEVRDGKY
jgi:nucleoside-diphosphate-sugar epimerase